MFNVDIKQQLNNNNKYFERVCHPEKQTGSHENCFPKLKLIENTEMCPKGLSLLQEKIHTSVLGCVLVCVLMWHTPYTALKHAQ